MNSNLLIFYPFFPTYREKILQEILDSSEVDVTIVSGPSSRASIKPLSTENLPDLQIINEIKIGSVSIHPKIIRNASLKQFDAVVLAPATLSITVWAVLFARKITRRRTLLWGQCGRPNDRSLKRIAQEIMNRLASGLLVYGEMEKASASELGTSPEKVKIVKNAGSHEPTILRTPSKEFQNLAKRRGIAVDTDSLQARLHLLYIGRVTPEKKLDRLLDCTKILVEKGYEVSTTIVGGGTALLDLQKISKAEMLPVNFTGPLHSDAELQPHIDKATLIVAPESVGLLALDALNNGIPVVFPPDSEGNGPEHEALTIGLNAIGFTDLTGKGISDAIEEWIDIAPTLDIQKYEEAARTSSSQWSPTTVAKNIIEAAKNS